LRNNSTGGKEGEEKANIVYMERGGEISGEVDGGGRNGLGMEEGNGAEMTDSARYTPE